MSNDDEYRYSRRTFMKGAVSATAMGLLGPGVHPSLSAQEKPASSSVTSLSLSETSRAVRNKKLSPVDLTKACLERIERLNPKLNVFVTVTAESALAQAA